jgi:hypothetical protein
MPSVHDELTFDRVLESLPEFDRKAIERVIESRLESARARSVPGFFWDDDEDDAADLQLDEAREALSAIEKKFAEQPLTVDDLEPLRKALAA